MALSLFAAIEESKTFPCESGLPKNPFFFADGSFLLNILEMEKFVEEPVVFWVAVALGTSLSSVFPSSEVFITGKQVMFGVGTCLMILKLSGSGLAFRGEDSGLDTTLTSISFVLIVTKKIR